MRTGAPRPGAARSGCLHDLLITAVEVVKFGIGLAVGWFGVLVTWVAFDGVGVALGIGAAVVAVAVVAVRRGEWNLLLGFGTSSWLATCFVLLISSMSLA